MDPQDASYGQATGLSYSSTQNIYVQIRDAQLLYVSHGFYLVRRNLELIPRAYTI